MPADIEIVFAPDDLRLIDAGSDDRFFAESWACENLAQWPDDATSAPDEASLRNADLAI